MDRPLRSRTAARRRLIDGDTGTVLRPAVRVEVVPRFAQFRAARVGRIGPGGRLVVSRS